MVVTMVVAQDLLPEDAHLLGSEHYRAPAYPPDSSPRREGVKQQLQQGESREAGGGQKRNGMKHDPAQAVKAF
jgi:hypothetical protein